MARKPSLMFSCTEDHNNGEREKKPRYIRCGGQFGGTAVNFDASMHLSGSAMVVAPVMIQ